MLPEAESSGDGKAGRYGKLVGKTSTARCQPWKTYRSVRLITKNEPVAGRNIFHRARPCKGAKPAPWLWTGGTKEVRTRKAVILVDTGGSLP